MDVRALSAELREELNLSFYATIPAGNNVTELRMCCSVAPWISLGGRLVYERAREKNVKLREKCEIERKTFIR
jgi:hypothetical protein